MLGKVRSCFFRSHPRSKFCRYDWRHQPPSFNSLASYHAIVSPTFSPSSACSLPVSLIFRQSKVRENAVHQGGFWAKRPTFRHQPFFLKYIGAMLRSKYNYYYLLKPHKPIFHPTSRCLQAVIVSMTDAYEFLIKRSSLVSLSRFYASWIVLIHMTLQAIKFLNVPFKHSYSSLLCFFRKSTIRVLKFSSKNYRCLSDCSWKMHFLRPI